MPPVPSQSAVTIVKYVTSVCSSALGLTVDQPAAIFFANQIDVAADLALAGAKITPAKLGWVLAQKGLSIVGMVPDDRVQCGAAMAAFGINLGAFAVEAAATPEVPVAALGAYVQAFAVVSAYYAAQKECAKVVDKYAQDVDAGMMQLEYNIQRWVMSQ